MRVGTHQNTAYALKLLYEHAQLTSNKPLADLVVERGRKFFSADFASASSGPVTISVAEGVTQPAALAPTAVVRKKQVVSLDLLVQFESSATGSSPPSGVATFEEILKARGNGKTHEKVLGTAALVSGRASLSLKTQKILNQKIEVVYVGDANYQSATVMPR